MDEHRELKSKYKKEGYQLYQVGPNPTIRKDKSYIKTMGKVFIIIMIVFFVLLFIADILGIFFGYAHFPWCIIAVGNMALDVACIWLLYDAYTQILA